MIAKTTIGRSFKGCCGYNMAKVEQGQGAVLLSQGVRDYERKAMIADFTRQAKMHPDLTRSVWHTSLSFAPQDEARLRSEPQLLEQVAQAYIAGMGLDQSQYVVIRHDDTPHSHVHIIANRVRFDGKAVSDGLNYQRQTKLMRQIEQQYRLSAAVEQEQRKQLDRVPDRDHSRITMRDQVRACVRQSINGQQLRQALATYGIRLVVNQTPDGTARGLTFSQTTTDEQGQAVVVSFKGSKLHKDLSLLHIQQQLKRNVARQQRPAQVQPMQHTPPQQPTPTAKETKPKAVQQNEPKPGPGQRM